MRHRGWFATIVAAAMAGSILPVLAGLAALLPNSRETLSVIWSATALLATAAVVALIVRALKPDA